MRKKTKTILSDVLFWAPRVLCILFIAFISMFAFDVFGEGYSVLETVVALFMHLIPSFVLAGLTILAWKKEKWGGIAFLVLGVIFTIFFDTYEDIVNFL